MYSSTFIFAKAEWDEEFHRLDEAIASHAPVRDIHAAERFLRALPRDAETAREAWSRARDAAEERTRPLAGMPPHAQAFAGDPQGTEAERGGIAKHSAKLVYAMATARVRSEELLFTTYILACGIAAWKLSIVAAIVSSSL